MRAVSQANKLHRRQESVHKDVSRETERSRGGRIVPLLRQMALQSYMFCYYLSLSLCQKPSGNRGVVFLDAALCQCHSRKCLVSKPGFLL